MKQLVKNYSINTTSKTITLTDFTSLLKERLLLITDVTNQTTVYRFDTSTGVSVSGNVITFTTFTPGANTDALQIFYDAQQGDPVYDAFVQTVDMAGNDNTTTQTISAADTGSTSTPGQGSQNLITGTATANSTAVLSFPIINGVPESQSNTVIFISGNGAGTYVLERSPDNGVTWTAFNCFIAGTADQINTGTLPGMFHGNVAGTTRVRVRATALTSGTWSVKISSGIGTGTITVGNPLRLYDGVNKVQATIKPSSTNAASTDTAMVVTQRDSLPAGTALIGKVTTDQTNHGTTDLVAADITKIMGSSVNTTDTGTMGVGIFKGGNTAAVKAASTAPVATDPALVVSTSPNSPDVSSLTTISSNQTNGTQRTRITDGSNNANVLSGDSGYNGLITGSATLTLSFTTSTAGAQNILPNTNVEGYAWLEVVFTSVGTGLNVNGQFSNTSGGTYINYASFGTLSSIAYSALGTNATTPYISVVHNNFFQIAVGALTSGTVSGYVVLHASPYSPAVVGSSQAGSWSVGLNTGTNSIGTVQPGNTANTTPWLVRENNPATPTVTSVTGATTAATILAANTARRQVMIFNASTAILYLRYGGTATTAAGGYTIQIAANAYYELPYPACTAALSGIWSAANGAASVTEIV